MTKFNDNGWDPELFVSNPDSHYHKRMDYLLEKAAQEKSASVIDVDGAKLVIIADDTLSNVTIEFLQGEKVALTVTNVKLPTKDAE